MPRRQQSLTVIVIVALLAAAGLLYNYVRVGRAVSGQADRAVVTQTQGFERLRQVDPALVKWREVREIQLGTSGAKSFDVDPKGNLYVVDGTTLRTWSLQKPDQAPSVVPVQADLVNFSGELWLATEASMRDGAGSVVTDVERQGKEQWVADAGKRVVKHIAADGSVTLIGKGQLILPSPHLELALKPDGNLIVNNPGRLRVETYSPQGKLLGQFGRPGVDIEGFSGCCNPIDVAVLPDGRIVTAEKGLPRVKVYSADGKLDSVVATPADLSRQAVPQITVTRQGEILVLDARAGVVKVFAPKQPEKIAGPAKQWYLSSV
ncbi:MAG: hypothetical protein ABFE08_01775 [Armatimonadia bacterium]